MLLLSGIYNLNGGEGARAMKRRLQWWSWTFVGIKWVSLSEKLSKWIWLFLIFHIGQLLLSKSKWTILEWVVHMVSFSSSKIHLDGIFHLKTCPYGKISCPKRHHAVAFVTREKSFLNFDVRWSLWQWIFSSIVRCRSDRCRSDLHHNVHNRNLGSTVERVGYIELSLQLKENKRIVKKIVSSLRHYWSIFAWKPFASFS